MTQTDTIMTRKRQGTNNGCKRVRDGSNIEPNSAQMLVLKMKEMSSAKDKFEYLCSTVDALKLEKESHKF